MSVTFRRLDKHPFWSVHSLASQIDEDHTWSHNYGSANKWNEGKKRKAIASSIHRFTISHAPVSKSATLRNIWLPRKPRNYSQLRLGYISGAQKEQNLWLIITIIIKPIQHPQLRFNWEPPNPYVSHLLKCAPLDLPDDVLGEFHHSTPSSWKIPCLLRSAHSFQALTEDYDFQRQPHLDIMIFWYSEDARNLQIFQKMSKSHCNPWHLVEEILIQIAWLLPRGKVPLLDPRLAFDAWHHQGSKDPRIQGSKDPKMQLICKDMGVSKNRGGPPKSSICS